MNNETPPPRLVPDRPSDALLPCPFCGGTPKTGDSYPNVPGMEDCGYSFIECCFVHVHSSESPEDAASIWNRRAAAPPAEAPGDSIPVSELVALLPGSYYMDPPDGGDVSVLEQLRRMAADATRHRLGIAAPAAPAPDTAGALDGLAFADALLQWNRAQERAPIAIGCEYAVADQARAMLISGAYQAPRVAGGREVEALREALADLISWFPDAPAPAEWRIPAGGRGADDAIAAARAALGHKTCRFCGWRGTPETAADPYTTDGTVEVCGGCNNAESCE